MSRHLSSGAHPAPCEWATAPAAIIVHDPVAAGAFEALAPDAPPEDFLFRERPDARVYGAQHAAFRAELARHARVLLLVDLAGDDPAWQTTGPSLNQVFTRDSLITLPWAPSGYIRSRMKPEQRRAESRTMEAAVRRLGLSELAVLPDDVFVEGGDVVPFSRGGRRTLLVGHGPRTTRAGAMALRDRLVPAHADEVIAIHLADWRMNLDGGFLPVASDVVLADTASILGAEVMDAHGERPLDLWAELHAAGVRVIDVTREESVYAQACNAVCVGGRRIVCYDLCDRVARELRAHAVEVHTVPGSELVKGRGGPRCMSRPVYLPARP